MLTIVALLFQPGMETLPHDRQAPFAGGDVSSSNVAFSFRQRIKCAAVSGAVVMYKWAAELRNLVLTSMIRNFLGAFWTGYLVEIGDEWLMSETIG